MHTYTHSNGFFLNTNKIKLKLLTKVSRNKDVIDAALTSAVIMWVVGGQNGSL